MKFLAANLKNIVLIMFIWFTPYYLAWVSASAFAQALHEPYYLTLLMQIMGFLLISAFWTVYLGLRVILWIGFKRVKVEVTKTIKSFTNKSID